MHNLLAFAGGVMLSISFLELIPQSIEIASVYVAFFGIIIGAAFFYIIDITFLHIHPELCCESKK